MPDEDFHLADHARSQAHGPGVRRDDGGGSVIPAEAGIQAVAPKPPPLWTPACILTSVTDRVVVVGLVRLSGETASG